MWGGPISASGTGVGRSVERPQGCWVLCRLQWPVLAVPRLSILEAGPLTAGLLALELGGPLRALLCHPVCSSLPHHGHPREGVNPKGWQPLLFQSHLGKAPGGGLGESQGGRNTYSLLSKCSRNNCKTGGWGKERGTARKRE